MPALVPTDHKARVIWLGHVPDRASGLPSQSQGRLRFDFAGPEGEDHGGLTRPSCSRVLALYPQRGTEIRNVRQVTILSAEELAVIGAKIGLEPLDPALLGATIVVDGIPDFSHLPPSARLQGPDGVVLTVDMQNQPCALPGREIEAVAPGHGKAFRNAARGLRGVTAWVEREGVLELGQELRLFVPGQRGWQPGLPPGLPL